MALCWSCGDGHVIVDPDSGAHVCGSCGLEHSNDNYQTPAFDADGRPEGSLHTVGEFGYRERKIYHANAIISDLTALLGLSSPRAAEITAMVSDVTDGAFGEGNWFPVLVGACSYLVMRRHRIPLPIAEVASSVGCDAHEVGRMVSRVVQHLDLHALPEFDAVLSLERTIRTCPCFSELGKEKSEEMIGQGRFLLQCATKWFLTTGRQPLPAVAAVVAFVAEVNGVAVGVEAIAKEIHAGVKTSKVRLKELMKTLVRVARVLLPWGADVTVKNLVHNAPLLIRFMVMKSKFKPTSKVTESFGFDMNDILDAYSNPEQEDSKYFNMGDGEDFPSMNCDELKSLKISKESISRSYKNMLDRVAQVKGRGDLGKDHNKKRKRDGFDFEAWKNSWQGSWDSDKRLTLEQIIQRDVGYDAMPPSFVAGVEALKRRRIKIEAAKRRINEIMKPPSVGNSDKDVKENHSPSKPLVDKKRRRRGVKDDCIEWEDCLIELLLLHGVNEDEIEQGHYRRLLDLHIFNP